MVRLSQERLGLGTELLPLPVAAPELVRCREGVEGPHGFAALENPRAVVKYEVVAVGGQNEGDVEHVGVLQSLLHAMPLGLGIVLGLDDRDRPVLLNEEQIIDPLGLAARGHLATDQDLPLGEAHLLAHLPIPIPARLVDRGIDVACPAKDSIDKVKLVAFEAGGCLGPLEADREFSDS